jgi:tetratricopeptide (TPR) repeat protein
MLSEYPRATSWFDYALYLARKTGDWQAYAEALAGLGNMYYHLGNFPRARQYHARCLRVARRNRLHEMVGAAHHNLFAIEMDAGNFALAESHAAKAFRAYPPSSRCMPRLARDLSMGLTVMGYFSRALPLALEALNHFTVPVDCAVVWAEIARAAGGSGDANIFEEAWAAAWVLVSEGLTDPFSAGILLDLAKGAASLGERSRAARAAQKALEIAEKRNEGRTILEAEALLGSLHLQSTAPADVPSVPDESTPDDELTSDLIRVLRESRAAA